MVSTFRTTLLRTGKLHTRITRTLKETMPQLVAIHSSEINLRKPCSLLCAPPRSPRLARAASSGRMVTKYSYSVLLGRANSSTFLQQTVPQGPEGSATIQYFYRVSSFRGDTNFNCTLLMTSTTRFTDYVDSIVLTANTDGLDLKNHTIVTPIYSAGRPRDFTFQLSCGMSPYDYGLDLILDNISIIAPTS